MSNTTSRAAVDGNQALPRCAGPKLGPFSDRRSDLKFIRLLSEEDTAEHSHVFEVEIGSKLYALKMFKFYDPEEDRLGIIGKENEIVTEEILEGHLDPFYAECRAFGQIQKHGLNGKVAVACYGFMGIPAYYEEQLERKFGASDWDRPGEEYLEKSANRQPFRAIVKELIHGNTGITLRVVRKISGDLKKLRKIGVYPMDVRAPNYLAGRLLDLSVSYTMPHCIFEIRPRWVVRMLKNRDLIMFDNMIEEESISTRVKMSRDEEYCEKFRKPRRARPP